VIYSEYKFVDSAVGGVNKRNNVRLLSDQLTGTDVYRTYFRYPQAFADHVRKTNSVSGYNGFAYSDYFPIDIDEAGNPARALQSLREMVTKLEVRHDVNVNELWYFFSGSKGFHLYIPAAMIGITPSADIATHFKRFAQELLTPMNVKYDSAIYDIVRLLRVANTINAKSGLFKIQLRPADIWREMDEILEMAKQPRHDVECVDDAMANESLAAIYKSVGEKVVVGGEIILGDGTPRYEKFCIHQMMRGVGDGWRDNVCFRLAGHWRKKGLSSDITEAMLQTWNRKNTPPMSEREIFDKVRSAYRESARIDYGCNDDVMRQFCSDQCYLRAKETKEEPTSHDVMTFAELTQSYRHHVSEVKKVRIQLPIPVLGPAMRGISPGECLYMIARAGVGKTAGLINLFQWIARENREPFLFFSMEQPAPQVFERMAQVATGLSGFEIEGVTLSNPEKAKWIIEQTRKSFENVYVVERAGLTVDDVAEIIRSAETERIGKKVRLVGLDYMGLLSGRGKDIYQQVSGQARELQRMMKDVKTAGIVLAQINRAGGDGKEAVTMDMIRDSGAVEEVATFIIGLWNIKDKEGAIRARLLKNRHGQANGTTDLNFIKRCLRLDDPINTLWDDQMVMAEQFGAAVNGVQL
jgi:hypothetical protein